MNETNGSVPLDPNKTEVKTQLVLYDVLIPSIGAIIILLNLAVVVSSGLILKKKLQPRSTYLFLGNVALTDAVTGIAVIFGQVFPIEKRNHYICALQLGLIVASTVTSIYSVGLIAIDRFLYILHGIKYQKWVYPNRARCLIAVVWLIGCTIGFMPLFGWYGNTNNGRICWFILLAPKKLILLTIIIGMIPLLIVIVLYSIILYHALRKIIDINKQRTNPETNMRADLRMFHGGANQAQPAENHPEIKKKNGLLGRIFKQKPSPSVKSPSKWKAIKVVMFTTGSFFITWSPYFVASLIYSYTCEDFNTKRCKSLRLVIASPLAILGFTNSLINPIIYAWWHKGFRHFVQKRVASIRARNRTINSENSTKMGQIHTSSSILNKTESQSSIK